MSCRTGQIAKPLPVVFMTQMASRRKGGYLSYKPSGALEATLESIN